jgi:hypothetical protein
MILGVHASIGITVAISVGISITISICRRFGSGSTNWKQTEKYQQRISQMVSFRVQYLHMYS